MLTCWQCINLSSLIKYSKIQLSNSQEFCLHLNWCKSNLQARDKEIIINKEKYEIRERFERKDLKMKIEDRKEKRFKLKDDKDKK